MQVVTLIGIAVGLAMDAFAVSIASSIIIGKISGRQVFRLSFHFGLFQALMPLLGWLAGGSIRHYIESWDHWIAFGLLALIGVKAVWGSRGNRNENNKKRDPSRGMSLVILSVATSIDALAVGLSFAMLDVAIWYPCLVIGMITAMLSMLGMLLGNQLGTKFGKIMEAAGGFVLIIIGLKILVEHLFLNGSA